MILILITVKPSRNSDLVTRFIDSLPFNGSFLLFNPFFVFFKKCGTQTC